MQVTRAGLYNQEDELAGMAEANSDDAREPDWAPAADADSPDYYGDLGDASGSKKLQSSKKRVKGVLSQIGDQLNVAPGNCPCGRYYRLPSIACFCE